MSRQIVVASLDYGFEFDGLKAAHKALLYRNPFEIAGDGIDNDGNGFVDDVVGPQDTLYSDNGGYGRPAVSGNLHHSLCIQSIATPLMEANAAVGRKLPVSILPMKYQPLPVPGKPAFIHEIEQAAAAGAKVITSSFAFSAYYQQAISDALRPYDAVFVGFDRDQPGAGVHDQGSGGAFDNYIGVGLISRATVLGNGNVEILEQEGDYARSESFAIAKAAGKVGALWALNPNWSAAQMLEALAQVTSMDNPIIAAQGLSSELGGQIDLQKAVGLFGTNPEEKVSPEQEQEQEPDTDSGSRTVRYDAPEKHAEDSRPDLEQITVKGWTPGTAADEEFLFDSGVRGHAVLGGGDDLVRITMLPQEGAYYRFGGFDRGDRLDLSGLGTDFNPASQARFIKTHWSDTSWLLHVDVERDGSFRDIGFFTEVPVDFTEADFRKALVNWGSTPGKTPDTAPQPPVQPPVQTPVQTPAVETPPNAFDKLPVIAAQGWTVGSSADELFDFSAMVRADVVAGGGDDVFAFHGRAVSEWYRVRGFDAGDKLDFSKAFDGGAARDHLDLVRAHWDDQMWLLNIKDTRDIYVMLSDIDASMTEARIWDAIV